MMTAIPALFPISGQRGLYAEPDRSHCPSRASIQALPEWQASPLYQAIADAGQAALNGQVIREETPLVGKGTLSPSSSDRGIHQIDDGRLDSWQRDVV